MSFSTTPANSVTPRESVLPSEEEARARKDLHDNGNFFRNKIPNTSQTPHFVKFIPQEERIHQETHFSIHPWTDQSKMSDQQAEETAQHIHQMVESAYPENSQGKRDDIDLEFSMLKRGFSSYLRDRNNRISTQELQDYFKDLHIVQLKRESLESRELFAQGEPEQIAIIPLEMQNNSSFLRQKMNAFLREKKIVTDCIPLGSGVHGTVLSVTVDKNSTDYALKIEEEPIDLTEKGLQFWRHADFAASRLRHLPNIIYSSFFLVLVHKPGEEEVLYYLPANQAKLFGSQLPEGTKVQLVAQLMARAPGESLETLIKKKRISQDDVKKIAYGLWSTLQEMRMHNLAHRDLKAENIFYNPTTGKVTLLDFGSAVRLRKQDKLDEAYHSNPLTSNEVIGTAMYVSPRVIQQEDYGAEVDFFSYAMLLLDLLNHDDFRRFALMRFENQDHQQDVILKNQDSKKYLDCYLNAFKKKSPTSSAVSSPDLGAPVKKSILKRYTGSETARLLNKNPELAKIIQLSFEVSGGGEAGEAAFKQLEKQPYFEESLG